MLDIICQLDKPMKSLRSKLDSIKISGSISCLFNTEHNYNYLELLKATRLPIYFSHPIIGKAGLHFVSPDPRATSFSKGGKGSSYADCRQCTREGARLPMTRNSAKLYPMLIHAFHVDTIGYQPGNPA